MKYLVTLFLFFSINSYAQHMQIELSNPNLGIIAICNWHTEHEPAYVECQRSGEDLPYLALITKFQQFADGKIIANYQGILPLQPLQNNYNLGLLITGNCEFEGMQDGKNFYICKSRNHTNYEINYWRVIN